MQNIDVHKPDIQTYENARSGTRRDDLQAHKSLYQTPSLLISKFEHLMYKARHVVFVAVTMHG